MNSTSIQPKNWLLLTPEQQVKIREVFPLFDNFEVEYRGDVLSKKESLSGDDRLFIIPSEYVYENTLTYFEIKVNTHWICPFAVYKKTGSPLFELTLQQEDEVKDRLLEQAKYNDF